MDHGRCGNSRGNGLAGVVQRWSGVGSVGKFAQKGLGWRLSPPAGPKGVATGRVSRKPGRERRGRGVFRQDAVASRVMR